MKMAAKPAVSSSAAGTKPNNSRLRGVTLRLRPVGALDGDAGPPARRNRSASLRSSKRLQPALTALEHAQLAHAQALQQLDGILVAVSELVGHVGVAGQGHRAAGLDAPP